MSRKMLGDMEARDASDLHLTVGSPPKSELMRLSKFR